MVPACCAVGVNKKGMGGAWTLLLKGERGALTCVTSEPSIRCTEGLRVCLILGLNPQTGQVREDMLCIKKLPNASVLRR